MTAAEQPSDDQTPAAHVHDDECAKVLSRVFEFLDNEMDEQDNAKVRAHLNDCSPCLEKYDLENMVKQLVARSCACESAPRTLRDKVLLRIQEVQVDITRQTP